MKYYKKTKAVKKYIKETIINPFLVRCATFTIKVSVVLFIISFFTNKIFGIIAVILFIISGCILGFLETNEEYTKEEEEEIDRYYGQNIFEEKRKEQEILSAKIEAENIRQQELREIRRAIADEPIRCPKCESTQISSDRRGWNVVTGVYGSSQVMVTCLRCGHQWKAGQK